MKLHNVGILESKPKTKKEKVDRVLGYKEEHMEEQIMAKKWHVIGISNVNEEATRWHIGCTIDGKKDISDPSNIAYYRDHDTDAVVTFKNMKDAHAFADILNKEAEKDAMIDALHSDMEVIMDKYGVDFVATMVGTRLCMVGNNKSARKMNQIAHALSQVID